MAGNIAGMLKGCSSAVLSEILQPGKSKPVVEALRSSTIEYKTLERGGHCTFS